MALSLRVYATMHYIPEPLCINARTVWRPCETFLYPLQPPRLRRGERPSVCLILLLSSRENDYRRLRLQIKVGLDAIPVVSTADANFGVTTKWVQAAPEESSPVTGTIILVVVVTTTRLFSLAASWASLKASVVLPPPPTRLTQMGLYYSCFITTATITMRTAEK